MILSGAELYQYSIRLKTPVALKGATLHRREGALVRLTADDGSQGWGEASPFPGFSPESLDDAINQLRAVAARTAGREIPQIDPRTDAAPAPLPKSARLAASVRFAFESAVLNLLAASRGESLPEQLTDRPKSAVLVNGLLSGSIEKVLSEACFMKREGYRVVKLKVGRRDVAEDVEIVRGVGEILGDGVSLRLDANRAWDFDEALEFARGVSGVRIEYVEEPLVRPRRLSELARVWGMPVALDESLVGMAPEALERHPYARAVVLKPTLLGGVSPVLRFMEEAKALGMAPVVSSCYESGVGTGVLVALAAAGEEPAGLDTYRALAEDVTEGPLPLPAPTLDVRGTMEAARGVDVRRLEPVPFL